MYEELMFVDGLKSGNERRDELLYAACKAHITKNIHRKRRRAKKETGLLTGMTSDVKVPRSDSMNRLACDVKDAGDGPWSSALETYTRRITGMVPKLYIDPVALRNGMNGHLGNPAIAVSPQMNDAVMFAQLHLNKSQAPAFVLRILGNEQRALAFKQETELRTERWLLGLWTSNAGLFSSVVASVLPLMMRLAPVDEVARLETMSMDLKSESFAHLRNLLAQSTTQTGSDLFTVAYYVKSLFRESCARGDVQVAQCHLRMLEQLLRKMLDCNINCSRIALWSDALPALLQMRRPIQDFPTRMNSIIEQVWSEAEQVLPNTSLVNTKVPVCVISHTLREAFLHLRRALYVTNVTIVAEDSEQKRRAEKLFQWLTTKAEHHICRLLELFFDLADSRHVSCSNRALSQGQRFMELSFSLCLLYLYQKSFFGIEQVDGSDIHESAFMLYPRLKGYVQLAVTCLTASERAVYEDAIFWVVFVGSCVEERLCLPSDLHQVEAKDLWFHFRIVQESVGREISCWSDASRTLDQFVWNKSLEPSAKLRFTQSVLG